MKVIPETRRTHLIRDLRVYCYTGSIPLLVPMGIIQLCVVFSDIISEVKIEFRRHFLS